VSQFVGYDGYEGGGNEQERENKLCRLLGACAAAQQEHCQPKPPVDRHWESHELKFPHKELIA
jgi:hypothetical protein